MTDTMSPAAPGDDLRRRAEAWLDSHRAPLDGETPPDAAALMHELHVHQIELEMQNEQLRRTQVALEQARDRFERLYEEAPVGYLSVTPSLAIVQSNRTATVLLGTSLVDLTRRQLTDLFTDEDALLLQRAQTRLLRREGPQSLDLRLRRDAGTVHWLALQMALVMDQGAAAMRIALTDITERVRLREMQARLAAIVTSSDDAIVSRDFDGRVTSWNSAAERLFGFAEADMLGLTMDTLVPGPRRAEEADRLRRRPRRLTPEIPVDEVCLS